MVTVIPGQHVYPPRSHQNGETWRSITISREFAVDVFLKVKFFCVPPVKTTVTSFQSATGLRRSCSCCTNMPAVNQSLRTGQASDQSAKVSAARIAHHRGRSSVADTAKATQLYHLIPRLLNMTAPDRRLIHRTGYCGHRNCPCCFSPSPQLATTQMFPM